jgi:predicted Zn-dependent protease
LSARRFAAVLAILAVASSLAASAQSRKALAELGKLDPPAYAASPDRTGEQLPVFAEAMQAYERRRYERSADLLRRFVAIEPDDPAGNFFLAVSLMMTDDVGEAEDRLGVVIGAGPTAFEFPARFVRAKAWIRLGKLDAAQEELERVARSDDSHSRDAADLVVKVRALRKRE